MSDRRLVESANDFARNLTSSFFNKIIHPQQREGLERRLERIAEEAGMSTNTLKTQMGYMLMAAGGYLVCLNTFFFILPVAFLFLMLFFIGIAAVRDIFSSYYNELILKGDNGSDNDESPFPKFSSIKKEFSVKSSFSKKTILLHFIKCSFVPQAAPLMQTLPVSHTRDYQSCETNLLL